MLILYLARLLKMEVEKNISCIFLIYLAVQLLSAWFLYWVILSTSWLCLKTVLQRSVSPVISSFRL